MKTEGLSRRDFGKLFAVAALGHALPYAPAAGDEWAAVRAGFDLDERYIVMNAANLCPAPRRANEVLFRYTRDMDANPSFQNRAKFSEGREQTRKKIAAYLNVLSEEIVLTRNTSEGNNFVSSGLELKAGNEVVIFDENHPTNNESWKEKSQRFGFTVKSVSIPTPPPSEAIIKAMTQALTSRTKVLAFTHVTSTFGTVFPARELCRIARERGILTLVDGAQSFGVMDLDLKDMGCDFFTASSHKWLMGPKEAGVLYMRSDAQSKLWPSEVGVFGGQVGASKIYERLGQRDDAWWKRWSPRFTTI
jgi:selenocysteine lyase/cysteine desulfurase